MTKLRTKLRASLVFAALSLALAANAQKFGETVQVDIIEVPVTVTDRDGKAVRNLTKDNFELYDDGKRVPIEYFEAVDISSVTARPAGDETPLPPVATRNFLLLFDLENSSPGVIGRAQAAAKEFVAGGLAANDLVAVATFTAERGVQLLSNFSTDRELVVRAVESVSNSQQFRSADPLMLSFAVQSVSGQVNPGKAMLNQAFSEQAQTQNFAARRFNDTEMRNRLRVQLNQLGRIAQVLNRLHGQKQIILLSEGFDARLVAGRDNLRSPQSQAESEQVLYGQVQRVDQDQRFGNTGSARDLSEMAEIFRRSDVTLHAIDIAGVRSNQQPSNESLSLLTTPTGGTVFKNVNDLGRNFQRILEHQSVVYVLGYNATRTGKAGRFHTLKVKTVNAKSARVAHRSGYFEAVTEAAELEKVITLAEVMTADLPIDDVRLTISTTPMPGPNGNARVPVVVEIPGRELLADVTGSTATATLFLYAFDKSGRVADHLQQRIALDLAQAAETVRATGIRYFGTLHVPAGDYAVKALVRVEESGRIGFARSHVPVPSFDRAMVMPPLLFEDPQKWVMLTGAARGDEFPYPFAAGADKYVPKSRPELKAGGEYKLALFVYQMPLEGLGLEPIVRSRDGSAKIANVSLLGRTSADANGGSKLLFSFRPDGLASGEYELELSVRAADGAASQVSMPFVLR